MIKLTNNILLLIESLLNTLFMKQTKILKGVNTLTFNVSIVLALLLVFTCLFSFTSNDFNVFAATSAPTASAQVNASGGAVLRKSASASSSKVKTLNDNTSLVINKVVYKSKTSINSKYKWYYVTAGTLKGYIRADLVDSIKYKTVSGKTTASVNYRTGAGTSMKLAGTLKKGTSVTVVLQATPASGTAGSSSVWYIIKIGSKYYSVCSSKISLTGTTSSSTNTSSSNTTSLKASTPGATALINSSSGANLRKSASTSASKVATLSDNTPVVIEKAVFTSTTDYSNSNKWYYVNTGTVKGYIQSSLVDTIKYSAASGKVTGTLNYRSGAGTKMKLLGTLSKGKAVTVYLKATPVSSTAGSSSTWYMIKVGSKYVYVCSSHVDLTGSIFVNNTDTTNDSGSSNSNSGSNSSNKSFANMTDTEFDKYLDSQGFPSSYKTKIKALHKKHPNWVFVAYKTGISWNNALSKETANGVSLVYSSYPLSYRATDSNSYKGSNVTIYKTAATTTKLTTLTSGTKVTLLSETWNKTVQWNYVKLSNGSKGYIKGSASTQSYANSVKGTVNISSVNIRKGAGTANTLIKSLSKGTTVEIVLSVTDKTDGATWYKIKNGSGYAYVKSNYITLPSTKTATSSITSSAAASADSIESSSDSISGTVTSSTLNVRSGAGTTYDITDTITKGTQVTINGKTTIDGKVWYSIEYSGKTGYSSASYISTTASSSDITNLDAQSGTVTTDTLNVRSGAGTTYDILGQLTKGSTVTITGSKAVSGTTWYSIDYSGKTGYVSSTYVTLAESSAASSSEITSSQSSKASISASATITSPSSLTGTASFVGSGTYIPKDGSTWFNASSNVVAYYMDPRNFINEDRIYMFEDLSYNKEYQTTAVVSKVLSPTKLPTNGFSAKMFVNAGSTYGVSPVHLASRARQETGGGSIAITGYKINGKTVYNPFNIGASSSSNPVLKGLNYAYSKGWYTQTKAVNGGASFLSSGYITKGQNSIYFQRFNVANGLSKVGTHQYMTNIMAPYSEAYSTKTAYASYGITNEALTFIIPVYTNMPSSTSLP